MIRKEINEIKSLYTMEDCAILRMCGCFVDGNRNKVTKFNENFLNLPEEEKYKYFDIFRKTVSGTPGKNLIDMQFTTDSYADGGARSFLIKLKESELKDEKLLDEFYDKVITSYGYLGNYLILLINQTYDIPGITSDNIKMEDASDEVYSYIMCSICRVTLSKPGLRYFEDERAFHNQIQSQMVELPDIGFVFPAFNNRSADEDRVWFYTKDVNEFEHGFLDYVLDCEVPLPAGNQKETFQTLITDTLGEDADYETIKNIHENLNEMIEEQKGNPEPVVLDKEEVKDLFEKSGVKQEKLEDFEEHFERTAGEHGKLLATNIAETRKFEVKTPDVVVKVNPDRTDLLETMIIEGRQCLVIQIAENVEVNGISVNPDTGEVVNREESIE